MGAIIRPSAAGFAGSSLEKERPVKPERADRLARNESFFRQVNERIREVVGNEGDLQQEFLCECADPECTDVIRLTLDDYEAVRADSHTFAIVPGHQAQASDLLGLNRTTLRTKLRDLGLTLDKVVTGESRPPSSGEEGS